MSKKKSKLRGREAALEGRSMCRSLGCNFECDDPLCEVCPKCGSYCRAILIPPWYPKEERAELFAAWRGGEIAPWPELLMAHQAQSLVEPGRLQ